MRGASVTGPQGVADLLLVGASVWDLPAAGASAAGPSLRDAAVAIADGRIVAVGDDARRWRHAGTQVVDLAGASLLPGFRDGHLHPLEGGTESLDADLVDAVDVDEVLARLRAFVAGPGQRSSGVGQDADWVLGFGYPPEILPGGVGRATTLDRVVADRPVVLWSSDHHMAWCNSRALEVAGITAATPDPPRGTIVRERDGEPVGTLLEEADALLREHLPPRSVDKEVRGLREALRRMAAAGLVWGLDAWSDPERLAAYNRVADAGELTAGIDLAFKAEVDGWRDQLAAFQDARAEAADAQARRVADRVPGGSLTATTVKFFVDGVIEGGTAHLLEPYVPIDGGSAACHDHGIANWDPRELVEAACAVDAAGFQLHLHAIGDAAIRTALDTFEAVAERNGPRDRRPTIAHTHLVHPDDLPRFRTLGAIANLEPLWAQHNEIMVELTESRLGPERSRWQYPIGSLLRSGAHVSFGSDWPVSSHEPLRGMAVAITRQTADGHPPEGWLSGERITLAQAIDAYTLGTAYQAGDEHETGRIEPGRRADLVAIAAPLDHLQPRELGDAEVVGTWLAGRRVHGG